MSKIRSYALIMEKKNDSPIVKFRTDPIHLLILETLSKKPINSDYYSLVKRIKLSDYIKRPISAEKIETISKRSKDYMSEVGFAYGRLVEKNWVSGVIKQDKLRIHAPGPVIRKFNEEEVEELDIPDTFKPRKLARFQLVKTPELMRKPTVKRSQTRNQSTRPTTRVSASQKQARVYLNYLQALTNAEQAIINSQISNKKQELSNKFEESAKSKEKIFNSKGIFSPDLNKERAKSMIPVKMLSHSKVSIDPMMRNAKEIVMKEKISQFNFSPAPENKIQSDDLDITNKNEKVIELLEKVLTKNQSRNKGKGAASNSQKKVKIHWSDRLKNSMFDIINKTRPDERITNMPIL